ncbi:LysR substrate-binding domain-containing protein [Consotaella salsifontis]|uniref:Transcriptional regulator n=1 Tax=Consotaella salsifontis TaxID=1365950 RepID=A0A1T4S0D2_9HYPH|nr:LysR substrate-binding domain-containing protein [Consotaella salsifontis]SKA21637.1 transcriptional regulator [Consotaella salsifontis]
MTDRRDLPPLAAIRAFETAARHLSFTRAGEELGMTQAAVSYQIKLLEERVGAALFVRQARAVSLTSVGEELARVSSEALDRLSTAYSAARGHAGGVLSISVFPSFAAMWLAPRIGAFQMAHSDLAVRVDATRAMVDLTRDDIDCVIRGGSGHWPGLKAHFIWPMDCAPMASPAFIERFGPFRRPEDLIGVPMVAPGDPWWTFWFEHWKVAYDPGAKALAGMGDGHLEARSAMAGHGVSILSPRLVRETLASGQLVQLFETLILTGRSYWLCYLESRRNLPKIRAFRDWLMAEIAEEETQISAPSA